MASFADILKDWESQKKTEMKKPQSSRLPQDGQAWRYKKTEPRKKHEDSNIHYPSADKHDEIIQTDTELSLKRSPMNERSMDTSNVKRNPMNVWLQRYGVVDKDKQLESELEKVSIGNADAAKLMPCEASIDLHGFTREEACIRMEEFITECIRRGLRKILIIHGKGNHSEEEPVLKQTVRSFIESDKRLGRFGFADKNLGGRGATWVLIREKIGR